MMALIGYMEGTNPNLLSKLCAQGHTTLPVGNGTDGYGKCITHLTAADGISVVIAHLHKLVPISGMTHLSIEDRPFACKTHHIPIILVVPEDSKDQAKERLGEMRTWVKLDSPEELPHKVLEFIE